MGFSTHHIAPHAHLANLLDELVVKHVAGIEHPKSSDGKDLPNAFGNWIEQERKTGYRPSLYPTKNRAETAERHILAAAWNDAMCVLGQDDRKAVES